MDIKIERKRHTKNRPNNQRNHADQEIIRSQESAWQQR